MLSIRRIGEVLVWGSGLVPGGLWLVEGPFLPAGRRAAEAHVPLTVGQGAGLAGMALLSVSVVLFARLRRLEDCFGGLDSTSGSAGPWPRTLDSGPT